MNSSKDNMKSSNMKKVVEICQETEKLWSYSVRLCLDGLDQFTKGLSRNVIDNASMELGLKPT